MSYDDLFMENWKPTTEGELDWEAYLILESYSSEEF